jgi:hypothetical protein
MKFLKYIFNFIFASVIAYFIFFDFAIWVLAPIAETQEASMDILKSRIIEIAIIDLLIALGFLGFLNLLTWFFQIKIEKFKSKKTIILIFSINLIIVLIGLTLGIIYSFDGLSIEIQRNF